MAIKTSTSTVIVDKDYIHPSFDYTAGQDGAFLAKINGAYGTGAAALDNFGYSVAVGSGRIVVGARYDADNGSSSGSAYIFDLNGNFINKIDGTGGTGAATFDYFGQVVAVGSGRIVVGAHADDDNGSESGSAYIFDLDGNFINKINGTGGTGAAANDEFGKTVAVGSGRIVVGADGDDDNGLSSGSAYIFDLDGNFINKINGAYGTGAAGSDLFGLSVAVGSDRIVVAARYDDDNGLSESGSAYIFDLDGNFINKINGAHGTGANAADYFGTSVAVGSGRVLVGARQDDDNGTDSGSAYIFDLDGNFINKIDGAHGTGAGVDDYFGISVAAGSGRVVVGTYGDDDNGTASGSAYIFTTPLSNHVLDML